MGLLTFKAGLVLRKGLAAGLAGFIFLSLLSVPCLSAQFVDALGRRVDLHDRPQRIVSLAPSITEILYFLGLGEKVVGVTQFSNYPPEAASRPKVGSYVKLNVESIIGLAPDLAIGTVDGNSASAVNILEQAGIKVYLVNPRSVMDAVATIPLIGMVCGAGREADAAAEGLKRRIEKVKRTTEGTARPKVFLQINLRPIMSVNRNTFHHDVIHAAGGINVTANESLNYPRVGIEEVIRIDPDVIVISSMERGGEYEKARIEWFNWKAIKAVKEGRVHLIDSDLLDRPSPRLVDGIEEMHRIIHQGAAR